MLNVRPPAVAGTFYPLDAQALSKDILHYLQAADAQPLPPLRPKALIAPHAGYVFSGPIAASAYRLLAPLRETITRVVLLGPAHRVRVRGIALPGVDAYATPLGEIAIDTAAFSVLNDLPQVETLAAAHAPEHSLEVHLPFLQTMLASFKLLPLVVGGASPEQVADVLDRLWGGEETLIVVSTDMSHFLPYEQARTADAQSVQRILNLEPTLVGEQACGAHPVNGLLLAARRHGLKPHLLDARNSGDTAGDHAGNNARVVGYSAFAFTPDGVVQDAPVSPELQAIARQLTGLARNAIASELHLPVTALAHPDWMKQAAATFVTLTQDGRLRGCIGSLQAHRSLIDDLLANARAAAFRDPRFTPLTAEELPRIRVEVSILSNPVPLHCKDEADALAQLRPGMDGVIFAAGQHRATFLPQVWEQIPQPAQFLAQLKRKAGLAPDFWSDEVRLFRYSVDKFKEV